MKLDISGGIGWELTEDAETFKQGKTERRIIEEMESEGKAVTLNHLDRMIDGETYATIQHAIRRLETHGTVIKAGYGKYTLTTIQNE